MYFFFRKMNHVFTHLTWDMFRFQSFSWLIKINNFPASNIREAEQRADVEYNKISAYFCTAWKEYIQIQIFNVNNRNMLHFIFVMSKLRTCWFCSISQQKLVHHQQVARKHTEKYRQQDHRQMNSCKEKEETSNKTFATRKNENRSLMKNTLDLFAQNLLTSLHQEVWWLFLVSSPFWKPKDLLYHTLQVLQYC